MISKEKDLKNENRDQDRKAEAAALMPEQLVLLAADAEKLACALGMSYQGEKIGERFRDVLLEQEEKAKADIRNYLWHSFWLIIRKEDGAVIGMVDFKNVPAEKGNVEIGYGLGRQHERRGYMTGRCRPCAAGISGSGRWRTSLRRQSWETLRQSRFWENASSGDMPKGLRRGGYYKVPPSGAVCCNGNVTESRNAEKTGRRGYAPAACWFYADMARAVIPPASGGR